jgi:hypothetical protein
MQVWGYAGEPASVQFDEGKRALAGRLTATRDPAPLGELAPLLNGQNRQSITTFGPAVRVLPGAEKVHLASGGTRWARQQARSAG